MHHQQPPLPVTPCGNAHMVILRVKHQVPRLHFTLDVFFYIADALEVDPADLISASMIPDKMLKGRETRNTAE